MADIKRQYGGSWNEKYLYFFAIALATFLLTTNLMAMKFFEVGGVKFGGGVLFFPLCLIVGDIVTEVYGFRKTRQIIIAALLSYMFFMLASQAVIALPPATEWTLQGPFEMVFSQAPRIFMAGCLAYLVGELSNSYILSRMKILMAGRRFWLRAMVSTVVGQTLNTMIFQLTAFGGVMSLMFLAMVIVNGTILKIVLEAALLPFTTLICRHLKKAEGIDYFDTTPQAERM